MQFRVLALGTASLRYFELVSQTSLRCALHIIFSKCLQVCLAIFFKTEMADLKQRACLKFCFLLGKTAAETVTMLKEALKVETTDKTQVCQWFNHSKKGEMSEDRPRCGHPSTSRTDENVEKIRQAVLADRCQTTDEISGVTGVSRSSCLRILTEDMTMKRTAAKFVPRLLTEEQKTQTYECSTRFAGRAQK